MFVDTKVCLLATIVCGLVSLCSSKSVEEKMNSYTRNTKQEVEANVLVGEHVGSKAYITLQTPSKGTEFYLVPFFVFKDDIVVGGGMASIPVIRAATKKVGGGIASSPTEIRAAAVVSGQVNEGKVTSAINTILNGA